MAGTKKQWDYDLDKKVRSLFFKKNSSILNVPLDRIPEVKEYSSSWNIEKDKIEIVIVGVGGTGGYLVRDLSRFVYSLEKRLEGLTDIQITLWDPDVVEDKNVLRQNYLPQDVGLGKAEVMASRHSRAFGVNINYVPELFSKSCGVDKVRKIVVGCVDNNEGRREIAKYMSKCWDHYDNTISQNTYWIDAGNEKKTGQVIVGSDLLQDVTDLYPEILDPDSDSKEQVSCADRMLQDEQNMFVNLTASNLILNYIKNIILDVPMVTHGSIFNIDNKFDNYYVLNKKNG